MEAIMTWAAVVAVIVVAVVAMVWLTAGQKYRVLLADQHFIEIANAVSDLKDQLARGADQPGPAHFVTSPGLAVAYSLSASDEGVEHHLSMSYQHGYLARAAGLA